MPLPTLIGEVDWEGDPAAPYVDQVSLADNVVSYWRFNSGTLFPDEVGTSSGTIFGTPAAATSPLLSDTDSARSMDGVDDYVSVTGSGLAQAGSYTVMGWMLLPSLTPTSRPVFTKGAYRLDVNSVGKLEFTVQNHVSGVSTRTTVTGNVPLVANAWYHIACVHDVTNHLLLLYVNGVLEASAAHTVGTELWGLPLMFAARHSGTVPSTPTVGSSLVTTGATWAVPAPASIAAGDVLLLHWYVTSNNNPIGGVTLPTGWSILISQVVNSNTSNVVVAYKLADAGDVGASSYTFTVLDGVSAASLSSGEGRILKIAGCDTSQPFANPPYVTEGTAASCTTGVKYPQSDDVLALALAFQGRNVSFASADGTELYDTGGANAPGRAIAGYYATATTAATGKSYTVTSNGSAGLVGVVSLFLKGADPQDYTRALLDEWTFLNRALDEDDIGSYYEARQSGVGLWEEIAHDGRSDVRSAAVSYGRQYELNRMEAGTAAVAIRNESRDYDPANTSGAHYPNVRPNRKLRLRAVYNSTSYPLFEGFVERWPSSWEQPTYDEMRITASDGFKVLQRAGVSGQLQAAQSGAQINEVLRRALWSETHRAVDTGFFPMAADITAGTVDALSIVQDIADSELGIFFIDHSVDGSPATFHDSQHRWTQTRSINTQETFADDGTGIYYQDLSPSDDDDNLVNEWNVTSANGTVGNAVDAVSRQRNFPVTSTRSTRLDNPDDAVVQARSLLLQTTNPALRFDQLVVRMAAATDSSVWTAALGLAISDKVVVVATPVRSAGGSTITRECFVEGISWDINPSFWQVSFRLSPLATVPYPDVVILDDAVSFWRMDELTALPGEVAGARAVATATAQPGSLISTSLNIDANVVGVRAAATATARPGRPAISPSVMGAGMPYMFTVPVLAEEVVITGARATATATAQPGAVLGTGGTSVTVIGVRATATATAQPGATGVLTAYTGPVPVGYIVGVRAMATATAQPGGFPVSGGATARATATANAGGVGLLTKYVGPVV